MKPPSVGELKHRITFRRTIESRGADGSVIESQVTLTSAWARMIPLSGSEKFAAQGVSASTVYEIWVRWFSGLTPQDDFILGDREFDIQGLRNYDENNRWWVITATEGV